MKFLTHSSSTASSTITTTTTASTTADGNVHNSKSTPAGCIAGVFRRLLCINSLPTHPSDHHFKDSDHDSVSVELDKLQCTSRTKAEDRVEASATPSIVARLMGLESLPEIDFTAAEKSPNSIARSRSMNSVDLMKELVSIQGRHRRVKSFRETAPAFLELEDEQFFILSFENGEESRKPGVKSRKSETGSIQMKQSSKGDNCISKNSSTRRESVYEKNKENQDPMKDLDEKQERTVNSRKACQRAICDDKLKCSSNILLRPTRNACQNSAEVKDIEKLAKPINHKPENEVGRRRRMKKRKDDCLPVKKVETDQSDSENSSPNSVLDIMKFACDPEVTSSDELSRLTNSKSRRTLAEELENYRKLNHQWIDKSLIGINASCKSRTRSEGKCVESEKNDFRRHDNYAEMWGEICKMAERDTIQSNWILLNKKFHKFENYNEISREFEIQIFEELLGELADLLFGHYHKK